MLKKFLHTLCLLALLAAPLTAATPAGAAELVKAETVTEETTLPSGIFELDVGATGAAGDAVFLGAILTRPCFWHLDGMPACVDGSVLRLREMNEAGGLDGKPVRLLAVMDGDSTEGNIAAARALFADPRVVAVVGPHSSGYSRAVIEQVLTPDGGLGFYSSTATGDGLVTKDGWFFSALWPDTTQARAMARYLGEEKGLKKSIVVTEEHSAYSKALGAAFEAAFKAAGGTVESITLPSKSDSDIAAAAFAPIVKQIADAAADAVYVPCSALHVARFVRQAGRGGLASSVTLCGGDTWDHSDVFGGGARLEGGLFTSPLDPGRTDARIDAFRQAMALSLADVRNITLDTMLSYDTVDMILAAAQSRGATRQGIRDGWLALKNLPLITGDTSVGADGIIRRDICLLRIAATDAGYEAVLLERIPSE